MKFLWPLCLFDKPTCINVIIKSKTQKFSCFVSQDCSASTRSNADKLNNFFCHIENGNNSIIKKFGLNTERQLSYSPL